MSSRSVALTLKVATSREYLLSSGTATETLLPQPRSASTNCIPRLSSALLSHNTSTRDVPSIVVGAGDARHLTQCVNRFSHVCDGIAAPTLSAVCSAAVMAGCVRAQKRLRWNGYRGSVAATAYARLITCVCLVTTGHTAVAISTSTAPSSYSLPTLPSSVSHSLFRRMLGIISASLPDCMHPPTIPNNTGCGPTSMNARHPPSTILCSALWNNTVPRTWSRQYRPLITPSVPASTIVPCTFDPIAICGA